MLFSVDSRPKFIEDAITRLSWRSLDATDVVFCSNACVSINFDKRYEQLISIITIRNRYIEIYPLTDTRFEVSRLVFLEIRVIKIYLAVTIYFRTRKAMTKCESI